MSCGVPGGRFVPGDLVHDCSKIRLQFSDLNEDRLPVPGKHLSPRLIRGVALGSQFGERLDGSDRHSRRFQAHDELQPVQIGRRIQPVSGNGSPYCAQQARLLVVTQGMRGNPSGRGHLTDR